MPNVPPDAQRWDARDGDAVVGHAALWCVHGAKFRIDLLIDEAARRRGHGTRMLEQAISAARREGARTVQVRPNAADAASIDFATKRDFVETMRMHHLELVLTDARHAALRDGMDKLARSSIAIVTLADFAARSKDPYGAYVDVFAAVRDGWPEPDPDLPGDPPTVIDWGKFVLERAGDEADTIVAEQRGRLVGFTSSIGTGVRPEVRGLGVATALKVCAIDAAIARGETTMRTATGHAAMRHINEKLGFRETWCELRMVRRL